MRVEFLVFVIMFCLAYGCCGIISDSFLNRMQTGVETPNDRLGSSNTFHFKPLPIVRLGNSVGIERRDIQSQLTKRLCTNCLMRPQCKVHKKCDLCETWCTPEEISSITTVKAVESKTEMTDDIVTPIVGSARREPNAPNVAITRFGSSPRSKEIHMKKVHTIATLKSGYLKEVICKIFGIPDTLDIDTIVVWMTTHSNQPPKYDPEYHKPVNSKFEQLTEILNEELDKALQAKIQEHGKNYLTADEIAEVMSRLPAKLTNGGEKKGEARNSFSEEYLPIYPINPTDLDEDIPRILNPPVIQDTPNMNLLSSTKGNTIQSRFGESANMEDDNDKLETEPSHTPEEMVGSKQQETVITTPIVLSTKDPIAVTLPTDETSKKNTENVLSQSSTTGTLIVSPFASDSDDDEEPIGTTQEQVDTRIGDRDQKLTISPTKSVQNLSPGNHVLVYPPKLSAIHEDRQTSLTDPENSSREENVMSKSYEDENLRTAKVKPKIKKKKPGKLYGSPTYYPKSYRANEDPNELMVGVSKNRQQDENVTPTMEPKEKEIATDNVNNISMPQSPKQIEIVGTANDQNKTSEDQIGVMSPSDGSFNSFKPTSPSAKDTSEIGKEVSLKARTQALLGKIRERIEQRKKESRPTQDENMDVTVGSPKDVVKPGKDIHTSIEPATSTHTANKNNNDARYETKRPVDVGDHNGQEFIKVRPMGQGPLSSSVLVDDFDKAKAALEGVEKLVENIQRDTNLMNDKGFQDKILGAGSPISTPTPLTTVKNYLVKPQTQDFTTLKSITEPLESKSRKIIGVTKNIPIYSSDKTEGMRATEPNFRQPHGRIIETKSDNIVGSQPLEEIVSYDIGQPAIKIPEYGTRERSHFENTHLRSQENILGAQNTESPIHKEFHEDVHISQAGGEIPLRDVKMRSNDRNILGQKSPIAPKDTPANRTEVKTRARFSDEVEKQIEEPNSWSNAMGTIISSQEQTGLASMEPKDIFFIGNGIKLPLQMIRKNDGAIHLSVDLDKLCSCKNITCPKNHTAIEETLGTILEKEAELKDQLAEAQSVNTEHVPLETNPTEFSRFTTSKPITHGVKSLHGSQRSIFDNKVKSPFYSKRFNRKINVFKRSVDDELEISDEKLRKPTHENVRSVYDQTIIENNNGKSTELVKNRINNTNHDERSNLSPFLFKQLMDKKIVELKSKMFDIGRTTDILKNHMLFPQSDINTLLSKIGKELGKNTTVAQINASEEINDNNENSNFLFSSGPKTVKSKTMNSLKRSDEKYDDLIPIKKVYKFEKLEEELEDKMNKFNEFVTQYIEENKKIINDGAKDLIRIHEDGTLKKEIDIMNKLITWMRYIPINRGIM